MNAALGLGGAPVGLLELLDRYTLLLSDLMASLSTYADLWERENSVSANAGNAMTRNVFASSAKPVPAPITLTGYLVGGVRRTLVDARERALAMGWEGMLPEILRAQKLIEHEFSYDKVPDALRHLRTRIRDELAGTFLLHVRAADVPLYDAEEPFGAAVARKFPKATEDISEAGKCLGLRQYTAVVFHLMRAMEVMVQRLARRLGVVNIEKEWGKLLSDIGKAVEAMPKDRKRDRYSEAHALLYHVKQAWRNDTMHPKQTYTESEARAIYAAVRLFAENLSKLA